MADHHFDILRPKARKQYTCDWCVEAIPAGTVYHRHTGIQDGHYFTFLAHVYCDDIVNWFRATWSPHEDDVNPNYFYEMVDYYNEEHNNE